LVTPAGLGQVSLRSTCPKGGRYTKLGTLFMEKYKSKALVDWSGFGKTIGDVQGGFSLLEFLDFCTAIEGIVLYDLLVPVGGKIKNKWESEIALLQSSGVLSEDEIKSRPAEVGPRPDTNRGGGIAQVAHSSLLDSWYEAGRLLGAEKSTGISSLPLLRQRSIYEKYSLAKEEHTFVNLLSQYRSLSTALQDLRNESRIPLKEYYIVPIPPVPLIVLERSKKKEEFLERAIEVRDEFSELRVSLSELREMLDNPEVSVPEKMKYRMSWEKTWGTLGKYKNSPFTFDLADASKDKISIERSFDGVGLDTLQLTKIVEKAISESTNLFYRKRIRMLHKAAKNYLSSSDGDMNRQLVRLYNHEVKASDFSRLELFGISSGTSV